MKERKVAAAILTITVGVAAVAMLAILHDKGQADRLTARPSPPARPAQVIAAPTLLAAEVAPSAARAPEPLSQRVRTLSGGSPSDAFKAFMALENCRLYVDEDKGFSLTKMAERTRELLWIHDQHIAHRAAACGDLAESDMTTARRLELLERAARSGEPMAAIYLIKEGPYGDPSIIETRPTDPLVTEWARHMANLVKLAASKGDEAALLSLAEQYSSGQGVVLERNKALGYTYAVAYVKVREVRRGAPGRDVEAFLSMYASGLTAEQIDAARSAGEQIAAEATRRS